MSLIQIDSLTFGYDGSSDMVFENLSLQLDTDWRLGCIGRNGRGKTTLLQLLTGKYEYTGSISAPVEFDYFPFPVENARRDTLAVALGVCPGAREWELRRELSLLEVEEEALSRPFDSLSNGEQTKALLAALFLRESGFPLIDEPTNHLDLNARRVVARYLARKKGFILVSHDRSFLDGSVDHILSFNRTGVELQKGNYSTWRQNKESRDSFERTQDQRLRREVGQLSAAARQTSGWSEQVEKTKHNNRNSGLRPDRGYLGHKSAKMMKRAKSIENRRQKALEEKSLLLKDIETADDLAIHPLEYHKECLAEFQEVGVAYGPQPVFEDLSLTVRRGERIALCGNNGCGKSSVLGLLRGAAIPHTGSVRLGSGLILSHLPQDTSFLRGDLRLFTREQCIDESLFKAILRKLDLSRSQFEKDMSTFSAGQKKKVLLAGSLCRRAHLYLWDEPLNYIDVLSRVQIEELLVRHRPTMLFVEHDSAFVDAVATRRVQLSY